MGPSSYGPGTGGGILNEGFPDVFHQFIDTVHMVNKKLSVEGEIKTSLADILPLRKRAELDDIAYELGIYGTSGLRKGELAERIREALPNVDYFLRSIIKMNREEWLFFLRVAEKGRLTSDVRTPLPYMRAYRDAFIQVYRKDQELIFIIPDEIKALFDQLKMAGLLEHKEKMVLIDSYASAAVAFYGALEIKELVEIMDKHGKGLEKKSFVESVLYYRSRVDRQYTIYKKMVIALQFDEHGHKRLKDLLAAREGKPIYIPSADEFTKYCGLFYYEETSYTKALKQMIALFLKDEDKASELTYEIHHLILMQARMQDIVDHIHASGVEYRTMPEMEKMVKLIVEVCNNTRLWSNYGHTPLEMNALRRTKASWPLASQATFDAPESRNAPCPCGSGMKYKHCCGRVH